MSQPFGTDPQGHILLVGPDPLQLAAHRAFLEERDFCVTLSGTLAEARTYSGQLNYVLSALELGDGPGWQLVEHFGAFDPPPLLVFWGPDAEAWHHLPCHDHPRVLFLPEPFSGDQLILALYLLEGNQVF